MTEIVAKKALGGRDGGSKLIDVGESLGRRGHDPSSFGSSLDEGCSEQGIFLGEPIFRDQSFSGRDRLEGYL